MQNAIWLEMHYASGQVPMNLIRSVFRAEGFNLERGQGQNARAWQLLSEVYHRAFPGKLEADAWRVFRAAAERSGYRPAPVDSEAQEGQEKGPVEQASGLVEARERFTGYRGRTKVPHSTLQWVPLTEGANVSPPAHEGDAGYDLAATEYTVCYPNQVTYVPLGVALAPPPGYWAMLVGRSSLAAKLGLGCVPGVIDNGYRGEMMAGVFPIDTNQVVNVHKGDRLVQAILFPVITPELEQVTYLPDSERGHNGFGSTG